MNINEAYMMCTRCISLLDVEATLSMFILDEEVNSEAIWELVQKGEGDILFDAESLYIHDQVWQDEEDYRQEMYDHRSPRPAKEHGGEWHWVSSRHEWEWYSNEELYGDDIFHSEFFTPDQLTAIKTIATKHGVLPLLREGGKVILLISNEGRYRITNHLELTDRCGVYSITYGWYVSRA